MRIFYLIFAAFLGGSRSNCAGATDGAVRVMRHKPDRDVLGCAGMCRDVLGCAGMYWDVLGWAGMCWDVLGYAGMCWDIVGSTRTTRHEQVCTRIYPDVQRRAR